MAIIRLKGNFKEQQNCYYEFDDSFDQIGKGGMGIVYKGRMINENEQITSVAIKKLILQDPESIERARCEANIRLHSDNLVYMYDFVEIDSDDLFKKKDYYIISEFVQGIMLDSFIQGFLEDQNGIINPNIQKLFERFVCDREIMATEIIKSVLSGVMVLHDAGYLHRDIDPTNIMITNDGKVKLIDFGVARQLSKVLEQDEYQVSSEPVTFVGKVEYAACELLKGDIKHQNFSTDVYAIGILYFQLLTGHVPFSGSKYEVIQQQLKKRISLNEINSKTIREVIKKATEKKQNKRYASSALFRVAVDEVMTRDARPHINKLKVLSVASVFALCCIITFMLINRFMTEQNTDKSEGSDNIISSPIQDNSYKDIQRLEYERSLSKIDSDDQNTVNDGFIELKKMANNGYADAEFMVAYIYAFNPKEAKANQYKRALGIKLDNVGKPIDNKINTEAQKWLEIVIKHGNDSAYKCMYWLASYKIQNINEAKQLLNDALQGAINAEDSSFAEKIQKTISQLN